MALCTLGWSAGTCTTAGPAASAGGVARGATPMTNPTASAIAAAVVRRPIVLLSASRAEELSLRGSQGAPPSLGPVARRGRLDTRGETHLRNGRGSEFHREGPHGGVPRAAPEEPGPAGDAAEAG